MLKILLTALSVLILNSSLFAQRTNVKITQMGFGQSHGLRIVLNGEAITVTKKGSLLLETEMDLNEPLYGRVINKNGWYSPFWIEPGKGEVQISKKGFPSSLKVVGSESHTIYQRLKFAKDSDEIMTNFLNNRDNIAALHFLNYSFKLTKLTLENLSKLYFATADKDRAKLENVKIFIDAGDQPRVAKGLSIFDFKGFDQSGSSFATRDYRGKYLLLDFAATGCGPCWVGYPHLIEQTAKYQNLQVVTYNEDNDVAGWNRTAERNGISIDWPVLWNGPNKKQVFEMYDVMGWPMFMLISPEGKVLEKWYGIRKGKLNSTLKRHLN